MSKILQYLLIGLLLVFTAFSVLTVLSANVAFSQEERLQELLLKADRAAEKADREAGTREQLHEQLIETIGLYEEVLEIDPYNRHALNQLSKGYFAFAETILQSREGRGSALEAGYDYGVRSLRTNEDFDRVYRRNELEALTNLPDSVDNIEGLFWTGANLALLANRMNVFAALNRLPAIISLNRRVLEVDETYLGGGAHKVLGRIGAELLMRLPLTFWQVRTHGFNWNVVRNHFEKAIEISPQSLDNYFFYAKFYALERGEKDLARKLLEEAISRPIGDEFPLMNLIAKERSISLKYEVFGLD